MNYSLLSPHDYKEDKYIFGNNNFIKGLLWHEIGHLTINDLTRTYFEKNNIVEKTISQNFLNHFYTNTEAIINEYIIRAITIRLFEINNIDFAEYLIKDSVNKGFKEIESIKDYISKSCEVNNKFLKNDKYDDLINYVYDRI